MAESTVKTFDAVEMSRRLREETGRKLAALSRSERIALLNAHIRTVEKKGGSALILREEPPMP